MIVLVSIGDLDVWGTTETWELITTGSGVSDSGHSFHFSCVFACVRGTTIVLVCLILHSSSTATYTFGKATE